MRLLLVFVMAMLLAACSEPPQTVVSGEAMGSRYHITLVGGGDAQGIEADVEELMEAIEAQASQWRSESWVSRFNGDRSTTQQTPAPGHVWAMLVEAERIYAQSGGALDITAGPLVELWGFGAKPRSHAPSEMEIAVAMSNSGGDKLVLDHDSRTVAKLTPKLTIDLSALAKGYAVDQVAQLLDRRGVADYLIAFGGEVRARGNGPGGDGWVVRIEQNSSADKTADPAPANQSITLRDQATATSGGGEQRRSLADGTMVTHLIDPRTGRPITDGGLAVTVVADRAVVADAWATALCVTPEAQRAALAAQYGVRLIEPAISGR